ncbi:MAG: malectin domain-containing carbohydrate-binding protein [Candidatus Woesearchaeota archaeon]|nr:malectin domain-containing carbohydrate-binding protein [Candidatus Woesearchaeota archaeon]
MAAITYPNSSYINVTYPQNILVKYYLTVNSSNVTSGVSLVNVTLGRQLCTLASANQFYIEQISVGSHDADQTGVSMIISPYSTIFGDISAEEYHAGLLFSPNIPQGATITNAFITFYLNSVAGSNALVDWYGDDSDTALVFGANDNNITNRVKTTATVYWNASASNPVYWGMTFNSPNLSSIVQEIVNRGGWTSGNNIAFVGISRSAPTNNYITGLDVASGVGAAYYSKVNISYSTDGNVYNSTQSLWIVNCLIPDLGKVGLQNLTVNLNYNENFYSLNSIDSVNYGNKPNAGGNKSNVGVNILLNNDNVQVNASNNQLVNITALFTSHGTYTFINSTFWNGIPLVQKQMLSCEIPVIMFHRVENSANNAGYTNVSYFTQIVETLYNNNYHSISMKDYASLRARDECPAGKSFIMTFGDGFSSVYTGAKPILDAYNYTAVVGVISGDINQPTYLTTAQLTSLVSSGWEIAGHGEIGLNCSLTTAQIITELNRTKNYMMINYGHNVTSFGYPNSNYECSSVYTQLTALSFTIAYDPTENMPKQNLYGYKYNVRGQAWENYHFVSPFNWSMADFRAWINYSNILNPEGYDLNLRNNTDVWYQNWENDNLGSLGFNQAMSHNLSVWAPEAGSYQFKFRAQSGWASNQNGYGEAWNFTINELTYSSANYTISDFVNDEGNIWVTWGTFLITPNVTLAKGRNNITIKLVQVNDQIFFDYLTFDKVSNNLTKIINTSDYPAGTYILTAYSQNSTDYNFNSSTITLKILVDNGYSCINGATKQCGTTDAGECQYGLSTCSIGIWSNCAGNVEPVAEICDGLDNDCDSFVDEECKAQLKVTKIVINNDGGAKVLSDFPLFVNSSSVISGATNEFNIGVYTISETSSPGYTATISGDCAADGKITLAPGDNKICIITNDDKHYAAAIRINAGGKAFTDSLGKVWAKDNSYNTGYMAFFSNSISGTIDDYLYQTERYDTSALPELSYRINVSNGDYEVNLYFAEIRSDAFRVNKRVFDVYLEGALKLDDLDIYKEVGARKALKKTFNVTVADGIVNIDFKCKTGNPKISAIELISVSTP